MNIFRFFAFVCISVLAVGCSVETATVNGSPPVTPEVFFKAGTLDGSFQTASQPVAFMWPVEENGKVLNRDERIQRRADITVGLAVLSGIGAELKPLADEITPLIIALKTSEAVFVGQKCGLFHATTPDATLTVVTDWKEPLDDDEAKAIQTCQLNLVERQKVGVEIAVVKAKLDPVKAKFDGQKALVFGRLIGLDNYFAQLKSLSVNFSAEDSGGVPQIELKGFQGLDFSTESESDFYKIKNVVLDAGGGTLSFAIPYIEPTGTGGELIYVGEYVFELEINGTGGNIKLGGEIERVDHFRGRTDLGRASFSGAITKPNVVPGE